jgi:hypothetical protein
VPIRLATITRPREFTCLVDPCSAEVAVDDM